MSYTVRDFTFQMYRLINASNPTVPLHGDDQELAILVLNQQLQYYASNGFMLTIAQTVEVDVNLPVREIYFTDSTYSTSTSQVEIVTLTSASPSFTVANGTLYFVGDSVTGGGIPALSTILSISGNTVTITNNATTNGASALTFTHSTASPNIAYIPEGRLANLDSAWLELSGVTYPLIIKSRDEYLASWKYNPLQGLPRFLILFPQTNYVVGRLYPAPSQFYEFHARGKFQLGVLTSNSDLSTLPQYYIRYLLLSCARDVSMFKGRADAWTEKLENLYIQAKDVIESASEVNLSIVGDEESLLNGAWRVRAGI